MERIKEGIGDKLGLLIQYTMNVIAGFGIAFFFSWKLTLVMMALTPVIAVLGWFISKLMEGAAKRENETYSVAGGIAEEVLSCIRTVIAFNGQKKECDRYEKALNKGKRDGVLKAFYVGAGLFITFLVMYSSYGLAFWVGALLLNEGEVTPMTILTVFFSVMFGSFAIGQAGPQYAVLITAKGAAAAVFQVIDREPEIDAYSEKGAVVENCKGKISFENVSFQYPSRKNVQVMNEVSFAAESGQTVALVGPSGCGKSTVVKLMQRFYDTTGGKILLDGQELSTLNIRWLRKIIGVVSQEPVLFDATIEQNIRYGREDVTFDDLVSACQQANAHNFILKLPKGFQTMVGERGTQLSGGQKQRIAIARALVRNPKILLLDEATSALDSESEGIVQEALDTARKGRTTIVIAHRLSTIKNADKIVAIDHGEIKEMGTHAELIASPDGLYRSLVEAQMLDSVTGGYVSSSDSAQEENETKVLSSRSAGTNATSPLSQRSSSTDQSRRQGGSYVGKKTVGAAMSRQLSVMSARTDFSDKIEENEEDDLSELGRKPFSADPEKDRMLRQIKEEGAHVSDFKEILKASRPEWPILLLGGLVFGLSGLSEPAFALVYSNVMGMFSKRGDALVNEAVQWAIIFAVIGLFEGLTALLGNTLFGWAGERLTLRLRMMVFANVLRQDATFFDDSNHSSGRICTRLATDARNVKSAIDARLGGVVTAVFSLIIGVALAFYFNWQLAIVACIVFPLGAIGSFIEHQFESGKHRGNAKLLEEAGKIVTEAIENVQTVQSLTREQTFFTEASDKLLLPYKDAVKRGLLQAFAYGFASAIYFFAYAITFRFGAFLVETGQITPIDVFRTLFVIGFTSNTIGWATTYFPEYLKARFAAGLIFRMLEIEPTIDGCSTGGLKPEIRGKVAFHDVRFKYPTRPDVKVLRGLGFELEFGKTLALVGGSGCGKSTVVALLERFYDTDSGQVMLDGSDLRTMNVAYLREHISLVSQEPVLFNGSITDNIKYGLAEHEPNIGERVIQAAKEANIHDFITSLPEGYETSVGEKGTQLSGGQKQRVAIARALIRNPRILLLDEATSALDTESEKVVQEALDKARLGRTCIIVAHRLSTVQTADTIAVIDGGKIVEEGTHQELVGQMGLYYKLTKKQDLA